MADDISKMGDWFKKASVKTIDKVQRALIAGGNAIQLKARQTAPIDTGLLRNSIISTSNFLIGDLSVTIGPTVSYGVHVEFGTKFQKPQPYLIPAFNQVVPKVTRKIQQIVRNA